jgi:large subunit ribosomal protein L21
MYAIIKTGGKQYSVDRGDRLFIEKLDVEPGARVEFDRVLYLNADDFVRVGTPYLDAVRVIGTAVENGKAKKVVTFKYKAKKDYRKKRGHRQPYTLVEIDSITVDGETIGGEIEKAAEAQEIPADEPGAEEKPEAGSAAEFAEGAEDKANAGETTESETGKTETAEDAGPAEKPAAKRTAKPKTGKAEAAEGAGPAEKPAAKRSAKAKAEKTDAGETAKAEEGNVAVPVEKPAAKRTAKPKVENENADAAPAAPEEEK